MKKCFVKYLAVVACAFMGYPNSTEAAELSDNSCTRNIPKEAATDTVIEIGQEINDQTDIGDTERESYSIAYLLKLQESITENCQNDKPLLSWFENNEKYFNNDKKKCKEPGIPEYKLSKEIVEEFLYRVDRKQSIAILKCMVPMVSENEMSELVLNSIVRRLNANFSSLMVGGLTFASPKYALVLGHTLGIFNKLKATTGAIWELMISVSAVRGGILRYNYGIKFLTSPEEIDNIQEEQQSTKKTQKKSSLKHKKKRHKK